MAKIKNKMRYVHRNGVRVLQHQSLFKGNMRYGMYFMLVINFPRH